MFRALTLAFVCLALFAVPALVQGQGEEPAPRPPQAEKKAGGRLMRQARPDLFGQHDLNADGKLTLEELVDGAKKLIADADADQDGAVTKEEFDAHQRKMRDERRKAAAGGGQPGEAGRPGGRRSPEEFFNRIDSDGDGMLSLEEFKEGMGRMRRGGRGGGGGRPGGGPGGGGGEPR